MTMEQLPPWKTNNYSHSYWENGRRDLSHENRILCFETGYFGVKINVADLTKVQYGRWDGLGNRSRLSYEGAISKDGRFRMEDIELMLPEELFLQIQLGGKLYRAISCAAVTNIDQCRLWESGKIVQHYDLCGVQFVQQDTNEILLPEEVQCTLDIVVWPESLTWTLELNSTKAENFFPIWSLPDFVLTMKMKDWNITATTEHARNVSPNSASFSLHCDLNDTRQILQQKEKIHMRSRYLGNVEYPIQYEHSFHCFVMNCINPQRHFSAGYCDIRHYDEFEIRLRNFTETSAYVPFLFHMRGPANVTGVCPILCDEHNRPLGIPIQLSKNWHEHTLGHYVRFYALLPAPLSNDNADKKWTTYRLRIVYGFYGNLPSATHANLSLIGYHGRAGRWEQLAIGCWGETYCMDVELTCVPNTITDIRLLMCCNGAHDTQWKWTDAGWGGDWLNNTKDGNGSNLSLVGLKTAYTSQGPCLTEVHYDAWYGSNKDIDMTCRVRTLRTDDYARTFTKLDYRVTSRTPLHVNDSTHFFLLGAGRQDYDTPNVAYGNIKALQEEHEVSSDQHFPAGSFLTKKKPLSGEGPWWVSFHGQKFVEDGRNLAKGWRGVVIRSYEASFKGERCEAPCISLVSTLTKAPSHLTNFKLLLTPPESITTFQDGDFVSFEVELITIPPGEHNYYGTNMNFKEHLRENPRSWKTVHRETMGNNLSVELLEGGILKQSYPIIIETSHDKNDVTKFRIKESGVGAIPVRFENLLSTTYSLFECDTTGKESLFNPSVHGNDFWQTDYFPASSTYSLTFNIPMDQKGGQSSTWVLKKT